jgi:monoamine oxidase
MAFAKALGGAIRYGTELVALRQRAQDVAVVTRTVNRTQEHVADRAICTLPFSVLHEIEVSPPFSAAKTNAIREVPYTAVARVYLQSRMRLWDRERLDGFATTDLGAMRFWPAAPVAGTGRALMHSYVYGAKARAVAGLSPDNLLRTTLADASRLYPGAEAEFEGAQRGSGMTTDGLAAHSPSSCLIK